MLRTKLLIAIITVITVKDAIVKRFIIKEIFVASLITIMSFLLISLMTINLSHYHKDLVLKGCQKFKADLKTLVVSRIQVALSFNVALSSLCLKNYFKD